MRSDLIYDALTTVPNRYLLCQLASKATRKFHKPNTRIQETTNEVLTRFGDEQANTEDLLDPSVLSPEVMPERRAA